MPRGGVACLIHCQPKGVPRVGRWIIVDGACVAAAERACKTSVRRVTLESAMRHCPSLCKTICTVVCGVVAAFAGTLPTNAAVYMATILDPPAYGGSIGQGVDGGSQVGYAFAPGANHAMLWSGSPGSAVDLHPAGFTSSIALGVSGATQVGYGSASGDRALLWSGTPGSVVNLHPATYIQSVATAVDGSVQVGYATVSGNLVHAGMWNGNAGSFTDLHPPLSYSLVHSQANGVSGNMIVGFGIGPGPSDPSHALLWTNSDPNAIDLNPTGLTSSQANAASGGTQVGYGSGLATSNQIHAILWSGSAAGYIDLNPAGFTQSFGIGAGGGYQAGYGSGPATGGLPHALAWNGSAGSFVDLHAFLPAHMPAFTLSIAQAVASNGDVVGYASDGNRTYAMLWSIVPVPEARAWMMFAVAATIGGAASLSTRLRGTLARSKAAAPRRVLSGFHDREQFAHRKRRRGQRRNFDRIGSV